MVIKKMYQKEIIYMSLYNGDIKEGCVGYLKSEERHGQFRLELQVKNISGNITGNYPIRFQNADGWQDVDLFTLNAGTGKWSGSAAGPVFGAEIILSDMSTIKGQSKNTPVHNQAEKKKQNPTEPETEPIETPQIEAVIMPEATTSKETASVSEPILTAQEEEPSESVQQTRRLTSRPMPEKTPIYESKWEQLLATYEKIHPYGDDRVYVKLEPKDFVILPAGYQHLVNNSFLLHGFYNYRYLILGKERDFYLGVPGVFYEREKMVALMFGFEAFECEGGNAKEGQFGYYLRRVEL